MVPCCFLNTAPQRHYQYSSKFPHMGLSKGLKNDITQQKFLHLSVTISVNSHRFLLGWERKTDIFWLTNRSTFPVNMVCSFQILLMWHALAYLCGFFQDSFTFSIGNFILEIYFNFFKKFFAALGPRCCARAFSSCGERGLLFIVVRGLPTAVASLVVEHGF